MYSRALQQGFKGFRQIPVLDAFSFVGIDGKVVQEKIAEARKALHQRSAFEIFIGSAVFFFIVALMAFAFSFPWRSVSAHDAPVAPALASAPAGIGAGTHPLEMHIAGNGLILLRNAQVTGISGTTIELTTAWGGVEFKWSVFTNSSAYEAHHFGTRFLSNDGLERTLGDVHVGDYVTVTGMLDSSSEDTHTINADTVRVPR